MKNQNYSHLIEINNEGLLLIYRVMGQQKELYTSIELPINSFTDNKEAFQQFCKILGENIIVDSPNARKLIGI